MSRVIERYERWQAHAEPGDSGRMTPEERRRAQRWATYERNEVIMQSALRMAYDLEGSIDVSKSTSRRKELVGRELETSTTWSRLDRSGTCCRFLRLAFRVNMEQLKLVDAEPLEQLGPVEVEEIPEIDRDPDTMWNRPADATEEELRSAFFHWGPPEGEGGEEDRGQKTEDSGKEQMTNDQGPMTNDNEQMTNDQVSMTNDEQPQLTTDNGPLTGCVNNVNKVNNADSAVVDVSTNGDGGCDADGQKAKKTAGLFRRSRTRSKDVAENGPTPSRGSSRRARSKDQHDPLSGRNPAPQTECCEAEMAGSM